MFLIFAFFIFVNFLQNIYIHKFLLKKSQINNNLLIIDFLYLLF